MIDCKSCPFKIKIDHTHHISCGFPSFIASEMKDSINSLTENIEYKSKIHRLNGRHIVTIDHCIKILKLEFNENAIKNGWCTYPINFDPIWIQNCGIQEYLKLLTVL